jgi:DNA-binding transcriptional ArsR family regulator
VQALSHPIRVGILEYLVGSGKVESPAAVSPHLGWVLQTVAYHFRISAEAELVELDRTEPKYGSIEQFYRLTPLGDRALAIVRQLDEL